MHCSVSWGIIVFFSKVTSALVSRQSHEPAVYGQQCSFPLKNTWEGQQDLEGQWIWKVGPIAPRDCRLYVSLREVNVPGPFGSVQPIVCCYKRECIEDKGKGTCRDFKNKRKGEGGTWIQTNNCPPLEGVKCWIPPNQSSNQFPAIALQLPSVDLPNLPNYEADSALPLLYFKSEYPSNVETVPSDPLAGLFASSGELTPPLDILAPPSEKFEGGVQASLDDFMV